MAKPISWIQHANLDDLFRTLGAQDSFSAGPKMSFRRSARSFAPSAPVAIARPSLLLVISGWAAEQRISTDGRRQIFDFIAPGDFICADDIEACEDRSIVALTDLTALEPRQFIAPEHLHKVGAALADYAERAHKKRLYNHLLRIVHKAAYERVAHLLLDFHNRLAMVGMASNRSFALPLTQEMLADALGITLVHVNRVLQQLRHEGMIELSAGAVRFLRPAALAELAEFELPSDRAGGLEGPSADVPVGFVGMMARQERPRSRLA